MRDPRTIIQLAALSAVASSALLTSSLAQAPADATARQQSFEDAMRKVEEAEKARATLSAERDQAAAVARATGEQLRAAAAAEASAAPVTVADGDGKRTGVGEFAGDVAKRFPAPAPPTGGVPVKGNGPAPGAVPGAAPAAEAKPDEETIIDADELIFDGSGKFGEAFQVVVFEKNVRLQHPQFQMNSDKLTAFFKKEEPELIPGAEVPADAGVAGEEEGGNSLERAIATGREVTVTKTMAEGEGEPQIAKARKATYFADRQEVMLEIWPQVQRGRNLVMAKSKDTIIILRGEEMIVKGPVRTRIVGKGAVGTAEVQPEGKSADGEFTQIDASRGAVFNRPSRVAGQKEIFFDGNVSVYDPSFDMLDGDTLTAYTTTDKKSGESVLSSAVMRGQKVKVEERTGKKRQGTARNVAFYPSSGDIKLTGYPAIHDGTQWKNIDSPSGVMYLNEKTGDVKARGGRQKMSFTPGQTPG